MILGDDDGCMRISIPGTRRPDEDSTWRYVVLVRYVSYDRRGARRILQRHLRDIPKLSGRSQNLSRTGG